MCAPSPLGGAAAAYLGQLADALMASFRVTPSSQSRQQLPSLRDKAQKRLTGGLVFWLQLCSSDASALTEATPAMVVEASQGGKVSVLHAAAQDGTRNAEAQLSLDDNTRTKLVAFDSSAPSPSRPDPEIRHAVALCVCM